MSPLWFWEELAPKIIYLARGYLPMHLAADLMERGCIVEELENQWEASQ